MGKQINYHMKYESFLVVAQSALDKGCVIFKEYGGRVLQSKDISIVTRDCRDYYFHLPEAGEVKWKLWNTLKGDIERIDRVYTSTGNSIIEAGFGGSRLYVISGYYDDDEIWIPRPDCITKVYHSLVRVVKKVAPCRRYMIKGTRIHDGTEYEARCMEYVCNDSLDEWEKGLESLSVTITEKLWKQ